MASPQVGWCRFPALLLLLAPTTAGFQIFPADTVASYPPACASSLSTDVTGCNNAVAGLDSNTIYAQSTLQNVCNAVCSLALSFWFNAVSSSCKDVTYVNEYGFTVSIADVPGTMLFNYNQTCLTNDGVYCNVVLGNLTTAATESAPSPGADCNECALLLLQNTAQSPYGHGPLVRSKSIYQSYTSSCGYTGHPLTTTPTATATLSVTATAPGASATCSGKTYAIRPGDTCQSISLGQGIATTWILLDNDLPASCANFPASGTLCLSSLCSIYTVQSSDTCLSVAAAHNLTKTQLLAYNPWIDVGCYNFNSTVGSQICVSEPGLQYVPPSSSIGAPTVATSAVPVPTNVAANSTTTCGQYYEVKQGDYCDLITREFGLTLDDFRILNPEVNENCTNLLAFESYCVMPVGSYDSYPDSPFYTGSASTKTATTFTTLPDATYVPFFSTGLQQLAPNTSTTCYVYAQGDTMQYNFTGVSDCAVVADLWGFTGSDLQTWNPSLDTGSTNCTFDPHLRYCMGEGQPTITVNPTPVSWTTGTDSGATGSPSTTTITTTAPITTTSSTTTTAASSSSSSSSTSNKPPIPSPTQANSIARNCNAYAQAQQGDYCYAFAAAHGISTDQLYAWNSVLGSAGTNCGTQFWAGEYYCVGVAVPSAVQPDNAVPLACDVYAQAQPENACAAFAAAHGITPDQLYAWNSVLGTAGTGCATKFWAGEYYCVGVNGS